MLPAADHAQIRALHKAQRNARARARRRQRVVSWAPKWLRCSGCGHWTAPEGVEGYGAGAVFCGSCALAADLRRAA